MSNMTFKDMDLSLEISRAIEEMGFSDATEIQFKAIPEIQKGNDVIGRSQTGTGKTVAFGIPAIEAIDVKEKNGIQVMILCPTRELAVQACDEIKKLSKFKPGIKPVDVYGGAPMDRQIAKLKTANIVIGTPGRVMDHMRRRTLKINNLKMIVLDEADEMLSMGFREDIETILKETPEDRQTVLFSATMPKEILALTRTYQKNPQLVEVNKKQVTVNNIAQSYYDVPMGRKMDALNLMLRYYSPNLAMIFCNTKKMVDDITEYLTKNGFNADGLHGDMKQSQRTKVMNAFKSGKTNILVATDVAARGIDVNNIDYVINYDIPQNTEYYVHRIGRTGRAGKSGKAITICSGRRQSEIITRIAKLVKSQIEFEEVPTVDSITTNRYDKNISLIESKIKECTELAHIDMVNELIKRGYDPAVIAAVVIEMHLAKEDLSGVKSIESKKRTFNKDNSDYKKIVISIGRDNKVAPNHIVGALTERTELRGRDIGKIEVYDNKTVVSIPKTSADETLSMMQGCKICGTPVTTKIYVREDKNKNFRSRDTQKNSYSRRKNSVSKSKYRNF